MYIIGPIGQYVRLLCYKSIRGKKGGGYGGVVSHLKRLDKDCSVCIHLINIGFHWGTIIIPKYICICIVIILSYKPVFSASSSGGYRSISGGDQSLLVQKKDGGGLLRLW